MKSMLLDPTRVANSIIQELLTLKLLDQCRGRQILRHVRLPNLHSIVDIDCKDVQSKDLMLVPSEIWGDPTEPITFAHCVFTINNQQYHDVWIEMVLLIRTSRYCDIASSAYWDIKGQSWRSKIQSCQTMHDLMEVDPKMFCQNKPKQS